MKTEQLIADLASRATPVHPLPMPVTRLTSWLGIALGCVVGGVLTFGARQDIAVRFLQPDFVWMLAAGVAAAVLAGLAALVLAVPGAERSPALRAVTLSLVAVWASGLIAASIKVANQGERAIVLRLGEFQSIRGPVLFLIVPIIDRCGWSADAGAGCHRCDGRPSLLRGDLLGRVDDHRRRSAPVAH